MNFGPHSTNFNSATQQQNMNTYTNGGYYSSPMQPFAGFSYPYQSNMPYQPFYPQNSSYSQNNLYNCPQRNDNVTLPKREHKPLTVIDPTKNEVINLVEVSKAPKSNSLLSEIKTVPNNANALINLNITIPPNIKEFNTTELKEEIFNINEPQIMYEDCEVCEKSEYEITNEDLESSDQDKVDLSNEDSAGAIDEEMIQIPCDRCNESCEKSADENDVLVSQFNTSPIMKISHSIPNELASLSDNIKHITNSVSDNNLFENSTLCDIIEFKTSDSSRLIYDRTTLLKISKSPLCKKPELDCTEILDTQGSKNNLASRLSYPSNTLVRTVNGYKPPHLRLEDECSRNKYLKQSRRSFKCVLNKIAPQNFDLCFTEIITLITTTDWEEFTVGDYMDCLIEEIFDKAVKEEAYSVTYADLCTRIVKYDDKHEMKWSFKLSLINRCKHMFETPLQEQLTAVKMHWEKKAEEENDEKLRNLYKSDIEEQVKKAKDKYFGNIRFIGELFIHDLLKANIINICVQNLMSKRNEEDAVLSLCKLLETCGKKFDVNHNDKMKEYIRGMCEIAETEELNNRIKFRLFDIIEMSGRNWSLRKVQAQKIIQPKTLDEVKKDDLDEKMIEASKLSNKNQIRLNKCQKINNSTEIKLKPQNRNQALDFSSLQMPTNDTFELKPSYGQWASGSGSKDPEWQNVDTKRSKGYNRTGNRHNQFNSKSSPLTSRDESPSKLEIGGRFALLQQIDIDECIDTKSNGLFLQSCNTESDRECHNDPTSLPSTREQSPANLKCNKIIILDGDTILKRLLDSKYLEMDSWCRLKDVSVTIANWLDSIMEKGKTTRNMVGDELASLLKMDKLSMENLTKGIKQFAEDIVDLKTDIPLIWNFMAEFLERFIVDTESDIDFYSVIFQSYDFKDVANCLSLCITYADERLGHDIVKSVYKKSSWSFETFTEDIDSFMRSKKLNFLLEDSSVDTEYFNKFKDGLISLLPHDDEDANQFLDDNFTLNVIQTEQCVYFISSCVFFYISNLSTDDITSFLNKKKLFFLRILDRRSDFEKQILQALKDSVHLFNETGLLTSVIYGLSDNILSYEAFQQFIQVQDDCSINDTNTNVLADVIRYMLDTRSR